MYKNVYSALYEWTLSRWHGDDYMASWMTAVGLAGALAMNTVLGIMLYVATRGPLSTVPRWSFYLIPLTYFLINYGVFVRHDRYAEVVRRFRARPSGERRRVTILAWAYVIASYGSPLLFAMLMLRLVQR